MRSVYVACSIGAGRDASTLRGGLGALATNIEKATRSVSIVRSAREHIGGAKACAETERNTAVTARRDARSGTWSTCGARRGVVPSAARINASHGWRAGAQRRRCEDGPSAGRSQGCALSPHRAVAALYGSDRSVQSVCAQYGGATAGAECGRSCNAHRMTGGQRIRGGSEEVNAVAMQSVQTLLCSIVAQL